MAKRTEAQKQKAREAREKREAQERRQLRRHQRIMETARECIGAIILDGVPVDKQTAELIVRAVQCGFKAGESAHKLAKILGEDSS